VIEFATPVSEGGHGWSPDVIRRQRIGDLRLLIKKKGG